MLCRQLACIIYLIIKQLHEQNILGNLAQRPCFFQGFVGNVAKRDENPDRFIPEQELLATQEVAPSKAVLSILKYLARNT